MITDRMLKAQIILTIIQIIRRIFVIQVHNLCILLLKNRGIELQLYMPPRGHDLMSAHVTCLSHVESGVEEEVVGKEAKGEGQNEDEVVESHDASEESFGVSASDAKYVEFFENEERFFSAGGEEDRCR